MSVARYAKYKDSGIKYLGDVPEHWDVRQLAQVGRFLKGSGGSKEDITEDGVPCVRYGDLYTTHSFVIRESRTRIPREVAAATYTRLQYGDVLFACSGETFEEIGKSAVSLIEGEAFCGGDLAILRPAASVVPVFLGFASDSLPSIQQKTSMGRGTTVKHIYPNELRHVAIALPPADEQHAIAEFLQRETVKIDALVAEQRRLIDLLKEKSQAVISHAVTKGLNSHALMKPSGIEWLGDVPAHWRVLPFRRLTTRVDVGIAEAATHAYAEDGVPMVRSTNIKEQFVDSEDLLFLTKEFASRLASKRIHSGDILTTRTGANLGVSAVVPASLHLAHCFTLLISTLTSECEPRFYNAFINSKPGITHFAMTAWGASQPNISVPIVKEMPCVQPPIAEQRAIAAFLDEETARFDTLTSEATRAIDLLQERRTALISAAVTGKIDVRSLADTEAA